MALDDLVITPSLTVPARFLDWSAVRASGPGGQNVNKVASKVVLRFDFEACSVLAPDVRERLRNLAKNRLDAEGWITIAAQTERDQPRNLEHALARLSELIRTALVRPVKRRKTRPTAASRRRRLDEKRHIAEKKANRRTGD
ncbi:MAG: aminoacyl-tRNA hydrolase [Myxococcota bacterium]|nr:aminoacyl-tRNA hydrolase [Myxococcota bacterium]